MSPNPAQRKKDKVFRKAGTRHGETDCDSSPPSLLNIFPLGGMGTKLSESIKASLYNINGGLKRGFFRSPMIPRGVRGGNFRGGKVPGGLATIGRPSPGHFPLGRRDEALPTPPALAGPVMNVQTLAFNQAFAQNIVTEVTDIVTSVTIFCSEYSHSDNMTILYKM